MTGGSQRFYSEKVTFVKNCSKLAREYWKCKPAVVPTHNLTPALSCNRPPPSVGPLTGACRSKAYHHMARNPPRGGPGSIHTEPTGGRTVRALHPGDAPGYGVRPGHPTRYIIVNEHVPRKKLPHSATRVPRHYLIAGPPEILELHPHNSECSAPQNIKHPPRSRQASRLGREWEDEERVDGKRRPRDRRFLAGHQPHVYRENHGRNHGSKGRRSRTRRYGKAERDDGGGEPDHLGSTGVKGEEDGLRLCSVHRPPVRPRPLGTPKSRARSAPPQTESDSASLGSSGDQHHSSTDQYIQVIHDRCELAQKRSQGSLRRAVAESRDLVCSNV